MNIKLRVLLAFSLCLCLGQICSGSNQLTDEKINYIKERIRGISDQFIDDLVFILQTYRNNSFLVEGLVEELALTLVSRIPKVKLSKINVNDVKEFSYNRSIGAVPYSPVNIPVKMDELKIIQSILSKQLQPEQFNGMMNLVYLLHYPNATSEEIESTLNYLYGVDSSAKETSFLDSHIYPNPTTKDCQWESKSYSEEFNKLNSLVDIKPKVVEDFAAIREKFSCSSHALLGLKYLVYVIQRLHGEESKINACMIKNDESPGKWQVYWRSQNTEYLKEKLQWLESVLSTRLSDEMYRGIIDFLKATVPDTPIDKIEKALKYVYDDVPETTC